MFVNPLQLMRIAKKDVKLAESAFRQGQKKMLIWKQQTAEQNQQATIEGQIKSAQAAEESKQKTESVKGEIDIQKVQILNPHVGRNACKDRNVLNREGLVF